MAVAPHSPEVTRLVDNLFRRESGRLVSILTRRFGVANLQLAEDVVQDALVMAMRTWPYRGVPRNPSAWLLQTARHRALDQARRRARWERKLADVAPLVEDGLQAALTEPAPQFEDEIRDSQLRMMFVCCHPGLPPDAQVALTLKALCGFNEREIAAAFLTSEAAVAKRLFRARQFLREQAVRVELPRVSRLGARVDTVLQAIYLLFNEGYKSSHGDSLLRADLCGEAIRLAALMAMHPLGDRPATHALLALMRLNAARLPARIGGDGNLLLLAEQDRRLWNQDEILRGMRDLAASGSGDRVTRYHLEAGIAACHALAPDFAATDWSRILGFYDQLLALDGSPVVAVNRAVALARVQGPGAGLAALAEVKDRPALKRYYLLPAVAGQLHFEVGDRVRAAECFRRAVRLAAVPAERALLQAKLAQCGS